MDHNIIIMADGIGSRWNKYNIEYKQLLDVDGTPLTLRTIQQLNKYTNNIILIAPDKFKHLIKIPEYVLHTSLGYRSNENRVLLDGILKTKNFWADRTTIILGDVWFTDAAIRTFFELDLPCWILGRTGPNRFTGKQAGELFSLNFNVSHAEIEYNLITALSKLGNSGKLWDYYFSYKPALIELNDWTDDIDSPEAYKETYEKLVEQAKNDEK
jgi:hypothetical protein